MSPLKLVNGGVALVDDSDLPLVSGRRWRANYRYSEGRKGVATAVVSGSARHGTFILLHRLLTNCPDGLVVDHVDGDPLNNCRANLRICTRAQNMKNRRRSVSNKSGYKGVYRDTKSPTYRAEIKVNGQRHRLGSFQTAKQAHAAYVAAAKKFHGEFARAA